MALTSRQRELNERRKQQEITIADLSVCHFCSSLGLKDDIVFCPNCGFPQRGSQKEMKFFIWKAGNKKRLLEDHRKSVNKARNILYFLAGLNLVIGVIIMLAGRGVDIFISCMISAAIYLALGLWSRSQPFAAILSGFFFYILMIVLAAIIDPVTIIQGIVIKVFVIAGFVYGYNGARKARAMEKEIAEMNTSRDLTDAK